MHAAKSRPARARAGQGMPTKFAPRIAAANDRYADRINAPKMAMNRLTSASSL